MILMDTYCVLLARGLARGRARGRAQGPARRRSGTKAGARDVWRKVSLAWGLARGRARGLVYHANSHQSCKWIMTRSAPDVENNTPWAHYGSRNQTLAKHTREMHAKYPHVMPCHPHAWTKMFVTFWQKRINLTSWPDGMYESRAYNQI